MKRDMDLLRKMLFYVEENYTPGKEWIRAINIEGYSEDIITEHILLAYESGFFQKIEDVSSCEGRAFWIGNLSNEGYDFLDKIRSDTIWNKTKSAIIEKGLPMVVETVKAVASTLITALTEGAVNSILKNGGN